jgi:predicted RNA-binding Zn-ribbon protein involved in translation (DUF1610 family)
MPVTTEIAILRCHACNMPLVLGDGTTVTCPGCGAETPVPATYHELQQARRDEPAVRARAEAALRKLARPPSLVVQVLARCLDLPMLAFIFLFGIPITLFAVLEADRANRWLAPHLHRATADDVPFGYMVAIMCFLMLVTAFVPRAFGVYANRRATARSKLVAALSARPPETPGGPSTCRGCGAPLAVAPNAIVAICSYCGVESALVVDAGVADKAERIVRDLGTTMVDAAKIDRAERRGTLHMLARELGRYTFRTVLLGIGFALGSQETADKKSTPLSIVALVATVLLFIFFIIRSANAPDDAKERREGNDIPSWVGIVGPLVMAWLMFKIVAKVAF